MAMSVSSLPRLMRMTPGLIIVRRGACMGRTVSSPSMPGATTSSTPSSERTRRSAVTMSTVRGTRIPREAELKLCSYCDLRTSSGHLLEQVLEARRSREHFAHAVHLFFTNDQGAALETPGVVVVAKADGLGAVLELEKLDGGLVVLADKGCLFGDDAAAPVEGEGAWGGAGLAVSHSSPRCHPSEGGLRCAGRRAFGASLLGWWSSSCGVFLHLVCCLLRFFDG